MKKCPMFITLLIVIIIIFLSISVNNSNAANLLEKKFSTDLSIKNIKIDYDTFGNNPYAIIKTSLGTIKIELFKDLVPNTVDNFIKLTNISLLKSFQ